MQCMHACYRHNARHDTSLPTWHVTLRCFCMPLDMSSPADCLSCRYACMSMACLWSAGGIGSANRRRCSSSKATRSTVEGTALGAASPADPPLWTVRLPLFVPWKLQKACQRLHAASKETVLAVHSVCWLHAVIDKPFAMLHEPHTCKFLIANLIAALVCYVIGGFMSALSQSVEQLTLTHKSSQHGCMQIWISKIA